LIAVVLMVLNIKRIGSGDSPAVINHSILEWIAFVIEGIYWFHNFAPLLGLVRGRAMGLGNGAGMSNSSIANGQRSASVMVVGLLAAYVEFWVAMGFAVYILYEVFLLSLLKKSLQVLLL